MLTSNYNTVQCSIKDREKYAVGDVFKVPERFRWNSRFMRFDGLLIKDISFGWGIFLHFDFDEWERNKAMPDVELNIGKSYLF